MKRIALVSVGVMFWCVTLILILTPPEENKVFSLTLNSIIAGLTGLFIGWLIRKYDILDLLKIIFPTIVSLITAIWLFKSGFLNLRAENLKREIYQLEKRDSALKVSINTFRRDSLRHNKQLDSLINYAFILKEKVDMYPKQERNIASLKFENRKLKLLDRNAHKPIVEIIDINLTDTQREISLKFYDCQGNLLTDKDIGLAFLSIGFGYGNYDSINKTFSLGHEFPPSLRIGNNYKSYFLTRPIDLVIYKVHKKSAGTMEEYVSLSEYIKTIKIPFSTAKYEVTLNDFPECY